MSCYVDPIYIPAASAGASSAASHIGRMRLGEIFIIRDNLFELVCFHCSRAFHNFGEFTSHTHEHLLGIGASLAEPDKRSKRNNNPEKSMKVENKEIDPNDIFAGLDMDMDNGDDSDVLSVFEPEEFENDDDDDDEDDVDDANHLESDKSHSGIDEDVAERLAKENFELDGSPEAEEYSRYIYDYRFRNIKGWFKCPKCNHKSKKHSHIKRHIFTHLRRKIFKCTLCAIRLSNLLHVRQHQRFHQEEKSRRKKHEKNDTVECVSTEIMENEQFREVKAMLKANCVAIENTVEANEYLRYLCGRKAMPKHDNTFLCPKCSYSSFHPNHVKRHFSIHFKKRMFTCQKCLKKIGNIEDCRKHMNFVHGIQMDRINFALLDAQGRDDGGATSQESDKKSPPEDNTNKGVQCEICGETVEKLHIEAHMKTHNDEENIKDD